MRASAPRCLALLLCGMLTGCPDVPTTDPSLPSPTPTATPVPTPTPTPTPEPTPTPLPEAFVPFQKLDVANLFNGIRIRSDFASSAGTFASLERKDKDSYTLDLSIRVRVPEPNTSLAELSRVNPGLPGVLPALPALLDTAKVSNFWHGLQENKVKSLQDRLNRLDLILSRHNFYDCETILETRHPETGRKALLIQSEMDVNGDGSDGDRQLAVDQTSSTFQPFTSYRWKKRTPNPNEFLAVREAKLVEAQRELATPGLGATRERELREAVRVLKLDIADLKSFSFLLSRADPYIVVPGFMLRYKNNPFAPKIGDYAVVIVGNTIYPAIVGDAGPSNKAGEASLRLCRELNPQSGPVRRAENELVVTYLIFPDSSDQPFGPPDLARWTARCTELLGEIGGYGGTIRQWEDLTLPVPTPTPPPAPTATPQTPPVP